MYRMRLKLKKLLNIVPFLLFTAGIVGCGGAYVADVAGEKITVNDFEQVYAKNNGGWDAAAKTSLDDKQKFLELYVKFRLKVKEAYAKGYDKDPELQQELAEYRKNLGISYMLDQELTGPAIDRMYQRRTEERRAGHILIRLNEDPAPQDTLAAYASIMAILDSLKKGADFEAVARNNSQDPSVQYNGGDLYFFTAGAMVPEFEDAVFSLNSGEVTWVRTQFGYHVVKLTAVGKNQGSVHVSHIMKRLSPQPTPEDSSEAATALLAIRDSILNGGDFAEFARTMSDDTFSGQRGGDLGFIDRGRTVREFDNVMFTMKDGELSGIVKTQFGLHLVKRHETRGVPAFKDLEQTLRTEYQRNRFQYDYDKMIAKVKKVYSFSRNEAAFKAFSAAVDTTKTTADADWDSTVIAGVRAMTLFTYGNGSATVGTVIAQVNTMPELRGLPLKDPKSLETIAEKIGADRIAEYHARQLEGKFSDFARTMKEYEDGILLFKAEQEHVWNKVQPTDSALRTYHANNRAKYTWPDRVNIQEIFVQSDSIVKLVKRSITGYTVDSLAAKKTRTRTRTPQFDTLKIAVAPIPFDSAAVVYNTRVTTKENSGIWGLVPVSTNDLTSRGWHLQEKDSLLHFPYENGFSFVKVLQKDPAREKTFEEAQSEISGAFQEYETKRLGDEWYESLKKKYPVVLNAEGVRKTFTTAEKK
jgi:peptidyl-prolyl cis-trans isomerase SurA